MNTSVYGGPLRSRTSRGGPLRALATAVAGCWALGIVAVPDAGATTPSTPLSKKISRYSAEGLPKSAQQYYAMIYGVDELSVKLAESGQLVRFSYRVVDAAKAGLLQDKASSPSLIDTGAHVALSIPVMDKVGPLRQAMPAEADKTYWMLFSNQGNKVRSGHRVSVVVGSFRVDGLIVQ